MELVSTWKSENLENQKNNKTTTACNFQTMDFFVMPHDLIRGQTRGHANNILGNVIRSFMMVKLW